MGDRRGLLLFFFNQGSWSYNCSSTGQCPIKSPFPFSIPDPGALSNFKQKTPEEKRSKLQMGSNTQSQEARKGQIILVEVNGSLKKTGDTA